MNIELHIERLVLDGLNIAPGQRHALQAAVEKELTRLLATGRLAPPLAGGIALPRIGAPDIRLQGGGDAGTLGRQIAGAVYQGIGEKP